MKNIKGNKIDEAFLKLKSSGKAAFTPFISIGDPDMGTSLEIAKKLIDCGADMIELGFPFSDPMADGKVIQRSYERALKNSITMKDALGFVKQLKSYGNIPVIFFTYYNPVFIMGEDFARDAAEAGVDGVLAVDLPVEESGELTKFLYKYGIYQIYLLAPTTDEERMKSILSHAGGFVYYVSVTGVTGARKSLPEAVRSDVGNIKKESSLPVGVGFGVSSREQAAEVAGYADAVIIGSKIIKFIEDNLGDNKKILKEISEFAQGINSSLKSVSGDKSKK